MIQLISPYVILSDVIIPTIPPNVVSDSLQTYQAILNSVNQIYLATMGCQIVKRIIGLVPSVAEYQPEKEGKFKKKQKKVTKSMNIKFHNSISFTEYIPLSYYNNSFDVFNQDLSFKAGFKIFAQHLIKHIEETSKEFVLSSDEAIAMFKKVTECTEVNNYYEIAQQAIKHAKNEMLFKKYDPIVNEMIDNEINELQKQIDELQNEFENEKIIKYCPINSECIVKKLNGEIAKFDIDDVLSSEFKRRVLENISKKVNEFNNLYNKIKEKQTEYIEEIFMSYIKEKENECKEKIQNTKLSKLSKILKLINFYEFENECELKLTELFFRFSDFFDIKSKIKEKIENEQIILTIKNELKKLAKEKAKENTEESIKQLEELADTIIEEEIESQKVKSPKVKNITDFNESKFTLISQTKRKCLNALKKEFKEEFKEKLDDNKEEIMDKYIYHQLVKRMNEINSFISESNKRQIDEITRKIESEMRLFINEKIQKATAQIDEMFSTDTNEILDKSKIKRIESECQQKLEQLCNDLSINQTVRERIESFIKQETKTNIDQISSIAENAAQKNAQTLIQQLQEMADGIVNNEMTNQENKIRRSDYDKLKTTSMNLQQSIITNCISNLRLSCNCRVKENIQKRIENYITEKISKQMQELNQLKSDERNKKLKKIIQSYKEMINNEIENGKMKAEMEISDKSDVNFKDIYPENTIKFIDKKCDAIIEGAISEIQDELNQYKIMEMKNCQEELCEMTKSIAKKNRKNKEKVRKILWDVAESVTCIAVKLFFPF